MRQQPSLSSMSFTICCKYICILLTLFIFPTLHSFETYFEHQLGNVVRRPDPFPSPKISDRIYFSRPSLLYKRAHWVQLAQCGHILCEVREGVCEVFHYTDSNTTVIGLRPITSDQDSGAMDESKYCTPFRCSPLSSIFSMSD